MQNNNMRSGGALFPRQKKTEQSPDSGGDFVLTGEELQYVLSNANNGEVKLEISAWRRMGRNNQPFTSLKISIPYAVRQPNQPRQGGYPPRRSYPPQAGQPRQQGMHLQGQTIPMNPMNPGPTGGLQQTSPGRYTNRPQQQHPQNNYPELSDPIPFGHPDKEPWE